MPRYVRKASYREDTPDRPIVGMAVIDVPILPDAFQTEEQQQLFANELDMIADRIGLYIGNEEDFEAKSSVREGSLAVDIVITAKLSIVLSPVYLVGAGLISYAAYKAAEHFDRLPDDEYSRIVFQGIRILEKRLYSICTMLKQYVLIRVSTYRDLKSISNEARTGLLGNLSRLADAVEVCIGTAGMVKRKNAMIRVRNNLSTLSDTIDRDSDRKQIKRIVRPLIVKLEKIDEVQLKAANEESEAARKYNEALDRAKQILENL